MSSGPVVAGVDGRAQGHDAVALGAALAEASGVPLVATAVNSSTSALPADELELEGERNIADALARIESRVAVETRILAAHSPARGLHDLAEEAGAGAVVVGSSHRGPVGRLLIGNVGIQLLAGTPCPVAVAPRGLADRGAPALGRIGVGFDGSPESRKALEHAASLAQSIGASVRVVHAVAAGRSPHWPGSRPADRSERRQEAEAALAEALAGMPSRVEAEFRLVEGDPIDALESEARDDLDLLVLGSRAFGPVRRVLLGSVSSELMRQAPAPVMVVPRTAGDESGRG
jgi:nucleotide-binding universal stress UspA family protein